MPDAKEHKTKADKNIAFFESFATSDSPEWKVVVAFYSALHMVERLASCEMVHNSDHHRRLAYLRSHRSHKAIYPAFTALHDASGIARYDTDGRFAKAFPGDHVQRILLDTFFARIRQYVDEFFVARNTPLKA